MTPFQRLAAVGLVVVGAVTFAAFNEVRAQTIDGFSPGPLPAEVVIPYGYNGSTFDRLLSGGTSTENVGNTTLGNLSTRGFPFLYNGSNWDRARSALGAVAGTSNQGVAAVVSYAGANATYNISAATVVKASAGRLFKISVIVAGAAGTVNDVATTGGAAIGNQISVIPAANGVFDFNWPCATGIVIVPGAGQVVAVTWQ
jgi:hypothetical protein